MSAVEKLSEEQEIDLDMSLDDLDSHAEYYNEENDELWLISYADMMTLLMAFFALLLSMSKFDLETLENVKEEASQYFGGEYETPHQNLQDQITQVLKNKNLDSVIKVSKHPLGALIKFEGNIIFDSGSVELRPEMVAVMDQLADVVASEAKQYSVFIEGHTDDNPISSGFIKSNWELSALRASAVARAFQSKGFKKEKIKVSGYSDTRPLVPNRDVNRTPLVQNQAKNRRVVLKVLNVNERVNEEPL